MNVSNLVNDFESYFEVCCEFAEVFPKMSF